MGGLVKRGRRLPEAAGGGGGVGREGREGQGRGRLREGGCRASAGGLSSVSFDRKRGSRAFSRTASLFPAFCRLRLLI